MNNTFYPANDYRSYLAHHGVKGMKWGVRKERTVSNSYRTDKHEKQKQVVSEMDKLMRKNIQLKRDFGGSSDKVDDPEFFSYVAREYYGMNTDSLDKALTDYISVDKHSDRLVHGGPGSGRYPAGSGKNPFQHVKNKFSKRARARDFADDESKPKRNRFQNSGAWLDQSIKGGKDKPNKSPAEVTINQGERIVKNTADIVQAAKTLRPNKNVPNAKDLTDAELTRALQRLRMESEYDRLSGKNTSDGFDKAMAILSIAGSTVGIVGGVVTILATAKGLKK